MLRRARLQPSPSTNQLKVWELDLDSYASVQRFAARLIGELEVLHVVVENAGILSRDFLMSEGG
jgi:NAD(P)-dependent dehydrogenase (short-subunit alcohol dehydrogenase family)